MTGPFELDEAWSLVLGFFGPARFGVFLGDVEVDVFVHVIELNNLKDEFPKLAPRIHIRSGDANQLVLERLAQTGHQLGLTVNPGGNAFFAYPLMLRRTMIFGSASMDAFRAALQVSQRKREGVVYTPEHVTSFIVDQTIGKTLKPCPGMKTNIPFHGKQIRAKTNAVMPSAVTSTTAKMIPVIHFTNSKRNREIGRDRIIRKVPSSDSFATMSPPTSVV